MVNQPCPLFKIAVENPSKIALLTDTHAWSYRQLNRFVDSLCLALKQQGVREAHRVAFIACNSLPTLLLFCALWRLKAIACPLSPRLPTEQLKSHLERLKHHLYVDPKELVFTDCNPTGPYDIKRDALATFLFTSGSSGIPKIACHRYENHYYNALGATSALQLTSHSRYLLSLPLHHVGGISILFRAWVTGSTVVLSSLPLLEAIKTHLITHLSLVPTQLYRLLQDQSQPPPASLKCVLLGGAPLSSQLHQLAIRLKWPVYKTYGMTETSSMLTLGKILPFREIQIRAGEIFVRGKTLFEGYWNRQYETISKTLDEGWFATNDLGRFNEKAELEIEGRKDRQFICGGENIQPEEIEMALCSLPGIIKARVTPKEDREFGSLPIAWIEDISGLHTLETIRKGLMPLLPRFKHPQELFDLPPSLGIK